MPIVRGFRRLPRISVPSTQVLNEASDYVGRSNIQQYRRSTVASVPSERQVGKKVTRDERRAMLESFVDKYRAMNSGKFPTTKCVQKEIGGGYYYIKGILQKIEYSSKISSVEKELVKENKPSTEGDNASSGGVAVELLSEIGEVSSSQTTVDQQHYRDAQPESFGNLESYSSAHFELSEGLQSSTVSGESKMDGLNIAAESHDVGMKRWEETAFEDKSDFDVPTPKAEEREQTAMKNNMRESSENPKDDELTETPTLWRNLKSLANGFINIWKKKVT